MSRTAPPELEQAHLSAARARRSRSGLPELQTQGDSIGEVFFPARRQGRRHVGWIIGVMLAIAAGCAAFLIGGFEYRATIGLELTDAAVPSGELHDLRRALLDHAWLTTSATKWRWRVDLDEPARALSVTVTAPARDPATTAVTKVTTGFLDQVRGVVERARSEPGPDEAVLTEFRQTLANELNELSVDVHRIESALPDQDATAVDAQLRGRLIESRAEFEARRERLKQAEEELLAIRNAPEPQRAVIDPTTREHAVQADVGVQQDLKALRVQLAETRYQLLKVREASTPALAKLTDSARHLEELCSGNRVRSATPDLRLVAEKVAQASADYIALLTSFSQTWASEFARLDELDVDPRRAVVLDVQERLKEASSGFAFQAASPLGTVREQLRTIPADSAAQHEFSTTMVRAFHAFQSAHHRFEFVAADIKSTNNFRLDAAVKSARGLRHRSRKQLTELEERLAKEALTKLKAQRTERVTELEAEIAELRQAFTASLDDTLASQDRVNEHADDVRHFVGSRTAAGIYEERARGIREELARIDMRLNDLAAKRMDVINPDHLKTSPCRVDRWPANLSGKLLRGGLAAVAALMLGLGVQMWRPR